MRELSDFEILLIKQKPKRQEDGTMGRNGFEPEFWDTAFDGKSRLYERELDFPGLTAGSLVTYANNEKRTRHSEGRMSYSYTICQIGDGNVAFICRSKV